MRALGLTFLAMAAIAAAGARAETGVFPIYNPDGVSEEQVRQLQSALDEALDNRSVPLSPCGSAMKDLTSECARTAAQKASATLRDPIDEVVWLAVRKANTQLTVTLLVREAGQGAELFRDEIQVDEYRAMESLVNRAFKPAGYSGKLRVVGAPPGSVILVDRLAIDGDTARVIAGVHTVEVVDREGRVRRQQVDVPVDDLTTVSFEVAAQRIESPSDIGAFVAAGVSVVGVATLITSFFLQDHYGRSSQIASDQKAADAGNALPPSAEDPSGADWNPFSYGSGADGDALDPALHLAVLALRHRQVAEANAAQEGIVGLIWASSVITAVGVVTATFLFATGAPPAADAE